ncbi:sugar transferase [Xylophilus sp.]|uniref:sugar transferase n=1 Tax=Xylophilus sp. TaxID=2653893 RepID=UPI003FCCBB6A
MRPGITGLWQVSGRSNLSYAERVALDAHYVHHWTITNDLRLLWRTVAVVLHRDGSY